MHANCQVRWIDLLKCCKVRIEIEKKRRAKNELRLKMAKFESTNWKLSKITAYLNNLV